MFSDDVRVPTECRRIRQEVGPWRQLPSRRSPWRSASRSPASRAPARPTRRQAGPETGDRRRLFRRRRHGGLDRQARHRARSSPGKDTRVGYDDRGRLAGVPAKSAGETASLASASIETTEISVGADGITLRQASIGVSRLSAGGASVDRLEVRATTAYSASARVRRPAPRPNRSTPDRSPSAGDAWALRASRPGGAHSPAAPRRPRRDGSTSSLCGPTRRRPG